MASLVIWGLVLLFDSELKKIKKNHLHFLRKQYIIIFNLRFSESKNQ